ncbi:MAG TPA: hypothetical protein VE956_13665 [Nodularia sp. (in: cyanobacteria)]|nr:hypothetical protein [Nodularia sp. (in: cyanobacteria)]
MFLINENLEIGQLVYYHDDFTEEYVACEVIELDQSLGLVNVLPLPGRTVIRLPKVLASSDVFTAQELGLEE